MHPDAFCGLLKRFNSDCGDLSCIQSVSFLLRLHDLQSHMNVHASLPLGESEERQRTIAVHRCKKGEPVSLCALWYGMESLTMFADIRLLVVRINLILRSRWRNGAFRGCLTSAFPFSLFQFWALGSGSACLAIQPPPGSIDLTNFQSYSTGFRSKVSLTVHQFWAINSRGQGQGEHSRHRATAVRVLRVLQFFRSAHWLADFSSTGSCRMTMGK